MADVSTPAPPERLSSRRSKTDKRIQHRELECCFSITGSNRMSLGTILLVILILILIGVFPTWPHSSARTAN